MPDRGIELAEQKLVRGRQYDQISVRCEVTGGTIQLRSIVRDVLDHVDVEDGIETRHFLDTLDRADIVDGGVADDRLGP
jgi:hypothetical protein